MVGVMVLISLEKWTFFFFLADRKTDVECVKLINLFLKRNGAFKEMFSFLYSAEVDRFEPNNGTGFMQSWVSIERFKSNLLYPFVILPSVTMI